MYELRVLSHFAAAHQLKMVAEKCENLHGHNWKVEAYLSGEQLNSAGVLIDFGIVKQYINEIMDKLDHKFLNDLDYFENGNPSSENIAFFIAESLQIYLKDESGVNVSRVTVWESENASATYIVPNRASTSHCFPK